MRNLSFISQPWACTAAMVVSEIMERLSPERGAAGHRGDHRTSSKPVACSSRRRRGRAEMVPTEATTDTKQAIRNRPATANWLGRCIQEQEHCAVCAADTAPEKAPAGQDVLVSHAGGHHLQLGVEVKLPVLEAGDRQGDREDTMAGVW